MLIDKQKVVDLLKGRGENDKAQQADSDLPNHVDTAQHQGALQRLDLGTADLAAAAGDFGL